MVEVFNESTPNYSRIIQVNIDSNSQQEVCEGLLALAKEIAKLKNYHASELWFQDYSDEDGVCNIFFVYWLIDDEEVKTTAYLEPSYASTTIDALQYEYPGLCMIQLQHQAGKGQSNIGKLLVELANLFKQYPSLRLYDLSLHDVADTNAVDRPILRAYYTKG